MRTAPEAAVEPATEEPAAEDPAAEEPAAEEKEGRGSLLPVIRLLPAAAYDNPTWRGLAYFGRDLGFYAAAVAGLALTDNPVLLAPLWLLAVLSVAALFVVGHDAAHGALFRSKRLNSIVGHVGMFPSFHVYEGWVLGHNRVHHGYTVRQGYDFVWHPYTVDDFRAMHRWQQLRHRFEWSWLGAGAYYTREVWWNRMMVGEVPKRFRAAIHRDRAIVVGVVAIAVAVTGWLGWIGDGLAGAVWTPLKLLVIPFLGFQFVIGSLVHVHHIQPGIRWWPRREWTKFKGQMEGTTIMRAPRGLNLFFHWIMVHIPHHVDVRIPMYRLELAADAIKSAYPDTVRDAPLRFRDFVANTRACKLYDFDAGHWMTYRDAHTTATG